MLSFKNLTIQAGDRPLFTAQELRLEKGLFALIGRNGSGKTSLIRTILGNQPAGSGEVSIDDKPIHEVQQTELAKKVAVVYSRPQVFGQHTLYDVVALGRIPHLNLYGKLREDDHRRIDHVLNQLGLNEMKQARFNSLSDGEKQLGMIARALSQDTPIILMDEPGAFLDLVNRHQLMKVLFEIVRSSDKLVIFSTHHLDQLKKYCDGVLLIDSGQLRLIDDKDTFLEQIKQAFKIEDHEPDA